MSTIQTGRSTQQLSANAGQPVEPDDVLRRRLARALRDRRGEIASAWLGAQFDEERLARFAVEGWREQSGDRLSEFFIVPLLELLIVYVETGDIVYEQLYLDERLRYAPHQAPPAVRIAFFQELLPLDEEALLAAIPDDGDQQALRSVLGAVHAPLLTETAGKPVRVLAMGDCVMNELRVFLAGESRRRGINLDFRTLYFGAQQGRGIAAGEVLDFLSRNPMDLLAFSFLTYLGIPPYMSLLKSADHLKAGEIDARTTAIVGLMRAFLEQVREQTEAPFVLHNASGLPLDRYRRRFPLVPALSRGRRAVVDALNERIAELADATPNTILLDEASLARRHGLRSCERPVVPHNLIPGGLFHTAKFGAYLAEPYVDVVSSYRALAKTKVLLVDFDNTLWDGVMADGPVRHYQDRQRLLHQVKESGILLVAVSKNDPENVRWDEIALTPDDFVLQKIGWGLKAESVSQAAQELDLGLDSFVLLDDNPVERELVHSQLPKVRALDGNDPATWRWIERMLRFPNTRDTQEARARTQLYREQAKRREALSGEFDYAEMMRSLELEVHFGEATNDDLARAAELVLRTNQFNTTTRRHDRTTLQRFLDSQDYGVYVASLSDRFGDLGVVNLAIVHRTAETRIFDTFIMSCRAMGFGLEQLMLSLVVRAEGQKGDFVGLFIPTDRNMPAMNLFRDAGFTKRGDTEWVLPRGARRPGMPDWFNVMDRKGTTLDLPVSGGPQIPPA